jgi:hypothetical protein
LDVYLIYQRATGDSGIFFSEGIKNYIKRWYVLSDQKSIQILNFQQINDPLFILIQYTLF